MKLLNFSLTATRKRIQSKDPIKILAEIFLEIYYRETDLQ